MQFHYHPIGYNSTDAEQQKWLFQLWIYLTQVTTQHPPPSTLHMDEFQVNQW